MTATIDIDNQCPDHWCPDQPSCEAWVNQTLTTLGNDGATNLSLRFVDAAESGRLNQQYRKKTGPTNVLSFPSDIPEEIATVIGFQPMGDIVICPEVLAAEAEAQNKSLESHWAHIMVHGLLHLCGFQHESEEQAETMENLEIEILKTLGIPNPYLVG